jgi:hypothetical protein
MDERDMEHGTQGRVHAEFGVGGDGERGEINEYGI